MFVKSWNIFRNEEQKRRTGGFSLGGDETDYVQSCRMLKQ